jgi:hypothetical protein
MEGDAIVETTCAACDCKLDDNPIKVKIGGKTVEVCCDECAQKLRKSILHDGVEEGLRSR